MRAPSSQPPAPGFWGRLLRLGGVVHGKWGAGTRLAGGFYEPGFFQLRGRQRLSPRQLKKWLGDWLNHPHWHALANDKLAFHFYLAGLGLPLPELRAVFHSTGRFAGACPCFDDHVELADFLLDGMRFPFFCKPVWGAFGRQVTGALGVDPSRRELELLDGNRQAVAEFVEQCTAGPYGNHLVFQELLQPHPSTAPYGDGRVTTVRLIVALLEQGPRILSARWRLSTRGRIADNFGAAREGSLLGFVDAATGRVERAIEVRDGRMEPVDEHPLTGLPFAAVELPDWDAAKRLTFRAATALPGLRLQHWDLALTDRGPVFLEVNALGDMSLREVMSSRTPHVFPGRAAPRAPAVRAPPGVTRR